MIRYLIISILSGILFGILDGIINANPLAQKLFQIYKPIAKKSINVTAGIIIDIVYGFVLALIFLTLYEALPGDSGILKGVSFAVISWFFRVFMSVLTTWMTIKIPIKSLLYSAITGFLEMLILGILYGVFLLPFKM